MVLEPIAPPRVGQVLNFLMAAASAGVAITGATVMSVEGELSVIIVGTLLAAGFATRFGGVTWAQANGQWSMPWAPRVASWILFGIPSVLVALVGATRIMIVYGAFVALDAAGGFVKREVKKVEKRKRAGLWARVKVPLLVAVYLGFVAAVHFTLSVYLPYGTLVTWSLLALGFAVAVRAFLVGPKAPEADLRAPRDHRKHERRVVAVPDPQRAKAEQVLAALKSRGDAGAFLEFVRDSAADAGLRDEETQALEAKILASFARAGTRREQDVDAALGEVERFLKLKKDVNSS